MWNYRGDLCPMTPRNPIESGCIFLDEEKGVFRSKQIHPGWAIHFNVFVFNKMDHLSQIGVEIKKIAVHIQGIFDFLYINCNPPLIAYQIYQLQSITFCLFLGLQVCSWYLCLISYHACGSPRHHQESWYRRRWPATATRLVNGWCEWVFFL